MALTAPVLGGDAAAPRGVSDAWAGVRRRRPFTARLSSGHVVMVVAGLLAAVLSVAALQSGPEGVRVAVAARDIAGGDTVRAGDFDTARVQVPEALLATLVDGSDIVQLRGRFAATSIAAGELVTRNELKARAAPAGLRAMSIPIDPSRAVGGRLTPGDRIDVLFAGEREVSIIIADARVLAVDEKGRGGIGETSSPFTVTVAVDAGQSQLLAAAIDDGDISIARTTGATPSKGTAPQPLDRVGARGPAGTEVAS